MSDSEDEPVTRDFKEIAAEIELCKKNPHTSGMFVSGWDDEDQDVECTLNPKESPQTHLLWASEHGEFDTVKELLKEHGDIVNDTDADGYTPLHRAAYSNHLNIISLLLSAGASVSSKTELGWTPLHSACNWNNYAAVARLLAAGADPAALSDGEQTPLHLAAAISHCKSTLLILLLRDDVTELTKSPNKSGETPEHLARGHGIYGPLFEMALPSATYIRTLSFTTNAYVREKPKDGID